MNDFMYRFYAKCIYMLGACIIYVYTLKLYICNYEYLNGIYDR